MSVVKTRRAEHSPANESELQTVPTAHEDMLASIDRTAFYSSRLPWLPLISPDSLSAGNERVSRTVAADEVRYATIVGHDAIKFEGEEAMVLPNYRTAELVGLLIFERRLMPPKHYLQAGFFPQATTPHSRQVVLAQTTNKLQDHLKDTHARPLATRQGPLGKSTLGITDVVIRDIRHTAPYKEARRRASYALFEQYIKEGGHVPGLFEGPAIEGARTALRSLAGSGMTSTQAERFRELSEEAAAALMHRTDLYDQKNPMNSPIRYARGKVAKELAPEWQDDAACGPETGSLFFPPTFFERKADKLMREARAKELCRSCPVQVTCAEDALQRREPHGIWGGMTEVERKQLLKQRTARPA